jgi:TRAP-type mannitol/chloroaromatic compound transport system permease small subunit
MEAPRPDGGAEADAEGGTRTGHAPWAWFRILIAVMNGLGTGWIFVLMLLITADVVLRNLFLAPIAGVTEMVEITIVGIVFLQLAHAVWAGRMIRSDSVLGWLMRRYPAAGRRLDGVCQLLGAALMCVIVWGQMPRLVDSWEHGLFRGTPGVFVAPTWPLELIIVIGSAAVALQFALNAWRALVLGGDAAAATPAPAAGAGGGKTAG